VAKRPGVGKPAVKGNAKKPAVDAKADVKKRGRPAKAK
jgi:hypothetical protein